jgi:endonuclease/exonuclease/phosphatase family metal-dependent hydrolase
MAIQKRRAVLRGIGGLISAGGLGTGSALAEKSDAPGRRNPLKVMSFNIHGGIRSDGVYDLRSIADVIEAADPDIVALQEVHDQYRAHWQDDSPTDYDAQHELLADWLDINHMAVGAIRDYGRSEDPSWTEEEKEKNYRRRILNVVLSDRPILESSVYQYETDTQWDPPHQNVHNRVLVETRLNVKGSHIWFYNTHLHSDQGSDILKAQAGELVDIAGRRDGTQILAGDFNFLDEREIYYRVADEYRDLLKEIGEDADTAGFDAGWGPLRLDYILGSEEIEIKGGGRITYEANPYPSDHYPIIADVTVTRGNRGKIHN